MVNEERTTTISRKELQRRATQIKLLITDCDGVLTDGGIYYSAKGEELRRFSVRDGMAIAMLKSIGMKVALISGERSETIKRRAQKLNIGLLFLGITSKLHCVEKLLKDNKILISSTMYVGDDINDFQAMEKISHAGLTACPLLSTASVIQVSHYHSLINGGSGALRDVVDWLLQLRGMVITHYPFSSQGKE